MRVTKKKHVPRSAGHSGNRGNYYLTSQIIFTELHDRALRDIVNNIYTAAINLPKPVRRVCYVQLCAFMAWSVSTYSFFPKAIL